MQQVLTRVTPDVRPTVTDAMFAFYRQPLTHLIPSLMLATQRPVILTSARLACRGLLLQYNDIPYFKELPCAPCSARNGVVRKSLSSAMCRRRHCAKARYASAFTLLASTLLISC